MGAFNWINIIATCPDCNKVAKIHCQTHIASDYDGDNLGRFADREYQLGEKMAWYPLGHKNYSNWRVNGKIYNEDVPNNIDYECCYADCHNCKRELYVLIKFEDITTKEVLEIGLQENWPADYFA